VREIAFSPDSKVLISWSFDQTFKLWNLLSKSEITTFKGNSYGVQSVALSADLRILAFISSNNTAMLWDLKEEAEIKTLKGI
jgi:WD40 repeat protein